MATTPVRFNESTMSSFLKAWFQARNGNTFTLEEALALEELPRYYRISDTSLEVEPGTIEEVGDTIAAAQAILDGARNSRDRTVDADYNIEDSAEAVLAA